MFRLLFAICFVLAVMCAAPAPVQACWYPGKFIVQGARNVAANVKQRSQNRQANRNGGYVNGAPSGGVCNGPSCSPR